MTIQLARRLFTVEEYYRMLDAGILHEDDRVELLEGEIVEMPPIGSRHSGTVLRLTSLFSATISPEAAYVSVQNPVRLSASSEPLPDLTLLRPRDDFYTSAHATAGDVLLLLEVADTSLQSDRDIKIPLYAREGISEVWLVDLTDEAVHVYRSPAGGRYTEHVVVRRPNRVSPLAFPDLSFEADSILGPLA